MARRVSILLVTLYTHFQCNREGIYPPRHVIPSFLTWQGGRNPCCHIETKPTKPRARIWVSGGWLSLDLYPYPSYPYPPIHTGLQTHDGPYFCISSAVTLLLSGVPPEVVAETGGWTSLAFLLYWQRMEEIIPLSTSKAYNSSHISTLSKMFEQFHIDQNIPSASLVDNSVTKPASHYPHPVLN